MVTEDYVSFETAMLLKEKGFDCPCKVWYSEYTSQFFRGEKYTSIEFDDHNRFNENYKFLCYAPTLQRAMKWLRKEHGLHCHSDYDIVLGWYCQITSLTETVEYDYEEMKHYHPDKDNGFSSPEEACEEAIKYCLENLI